MKLVQLMLSTVSLDIINNEYSSELSMMVSLNLFSCVLFFSFFLIYLFSCVLYPSPSFSLLLCFLECTL